MKSLHNYKTILFLFIALLAPLNFAQHHHHTDAPSVHGMFFFGQEKIYLSHLPMFHNPHDYQVLFEVEIPKEVKKAYLQSLKDHAQQPVYTIVPEAFVLTEMAKNPTSFMAQIYLGHFERGGTPITGSIKVNVKEVLYFKKFKPGAVKPELSEYILIGNEKEQYLVHSIVSKPDFDYISQVEIEDMKIIEELSQVGHINLEINSTNLKPLEVGNKFEAKFKDMESVEFQLNLTKSLYLEFGDLSF
ncbi:hypothetical protein A9Q84_03345 [Halobacteriovorax marinus]|uniref:Secreted protein n=1 Tax=Halobacteriovorax marinus TaxID=97084 RepID=A0A1Y5FAD1_9BACT|nr:hypothetical protein A9Q84_03345 [Halobacteriovorax marinus]